MALGKSKKILLRADACAQMGIGHMMRTLALGQLLFDEGYEVHFATITEGDFYLKDLKQQGFVVHFLEQEEQWDSFFDVAQLLQLARELSLTWIVLDGYQFTSSYELSLKQAGYKLLRIDDIAQGHYYADVILNQNFGSQQWGYDTEPYSVVLSGLKYVLLRREFRGVDLSKKLVRTSGPWQVMVSLGGSLQASDAVYQLMDEALINVSNVIVKKVSGQSNMALEMFNSDLAIVSGGSTMWELVYMGVPFLAVALNSKQEDYLVNLDRQGMCVNLGFSKRLTAQLVRQTVLDLIGNQCLLGQIRQRYRESMDRSAIGREILNILAHV